MENVGGFPKEGSYAILHRMFGHNCTDIVGNLILTDLFVNDDGTDPDLSFLETIREISGYLIIMHSNVARIPLTELRIIRAENGGYRINKTLEAAALVVRNNHVNGLALHQVDLRNLRSIVRGSVYIYDNPGLCYLPSRINWQEIFENVGEQRLYDDASLLHKTAELSRINVNAPGSFYTICPYTECSSTCPKVDGNRYCWGPLPTECQRSSKCDSAECNRCQPRSTALRNASCCHEQCLGGCSGPLASDCEGCKEFDESGTCVAQCTPPHSTIAQSGEAGGNPVSKYRFGHICLSECPVGFLLEEDNCVTHCSPGMMSKEGRSCQPCNGQCPKACEVDHVTSKGGHEIYLVDAKALEDMRNCTHLKGNLIISNESFHSSQLVANHMPITDPDQLWNLHSLREVSGYVYLDLGLLGVRLKNLSFLENLERVGGHFSRTQASVMIVNSGTRVPGLRNLRLVPHGHVVFSNNPHLCYLNSLPWTVGDGKSAEYDEHFVDSMQIEVHAGPSNEECETAVCHDMCDAKYGCWGPGEDQCVRCAHQRAGPTTCVDSCQNLPGFRHDVIPPPSTFAKRQLTDSHPTVVHKKITVVGLPDSEAQCIACHPECRQTCNGPGPHECIGDCKTAWADGRCVSTCPYPAYLDQDRRICEPCQKHCHQRRITHQPVCTGPGRYPGPGGCNKCEKFLVSREIPPYSGQSRGVSNRSSLMCFHGDCPSGTFLTVEKITPKSMFAAYTETYTDMVQVCWPCHSLCTECNAYGLVEAGPNQTGCLKCAGVWHRGICVGHCPVESTYEIPTRPTELHMSQPEQQKDTEAGQVTRLINGRCLACHPECHKGCWGPRASQCRHCMNFRVYPDLLGEEDRQKRFSGKFASDPPDLNRSGRDLHDIQGLAVCVPFCMPGLNFTPVDPHSGDRLCHHQAKLSQSDQDRIGDIVVVIHQLLEDSSMRKTHWTAADHTVLALAVILSLLALLFCFFCSRWLHRVGWSKRASEGPAMLRQLLPFSVASRLLPDKLFRQPGGQAGWRGDGLLAAWIPGYMPSLGSGKDFEMVYVHPTSLTAAGGEDEPSSNDTLISRVSRAPNLGRLVMINSDDLKLDEDCGPLGTGAFGAVYRGIWKVSLSDETSTGSLLVATERYSHFSEGMISPSKSNFGTEKNAESPLLHMQFDELSSLGTRNSLPETGKRPPSKTEIKVAVKILNDSRGASDLHALLDEAKVMASVAHPHCLPLLGVCVSQTRRCLVSGYVANGSLDRYLRQHFSDISVNVLLEWSAQIADGMAYLQSLGIIHRDLATRNVLVTSRDHLQITDFGLAKMLEGDGKKRHGEVIVRSGRAPIRWLAIETLTHGRYSSKTDVWAYGVTVWEIFTFGEKPYDGIDTANIKAHILSGGRLSKPKACTVELHQVMLKCWSVEPDDRPNFIDLYNLFKEFSRHPELYQTSSSFIRMTSNTGSEVRSGLTLYSSFQLPTQAQSPTDNGQADSEGPMENAVSASPSKQVDCGSTSSPGARRFELRRPLRNSLCSPSMLQHVRPCRLYLNQKRRSSETSTEPTLSTSLSMTSSGLSSDLWGRSPASCSTSALLNRSHLALAEVTEDAGNTNADSSPSSGNPAGQPGVQRSTEPSSSGFFKSWASESSHPLLSSDQGNSASHPMLCNLGYASSSSSSVHASDSSPPPHINALGDASQDNRPAAQMAVRLDEINEMPSNFVMEEAAGYVWPHWPSAYSEAADNSGQAENTANSERLPFLKRQLWLRRSARQHRHYLQQSLLHRAAMGMTVPEQANEELLEEGSSQRRQTGNTELTDRGMHVGSTTAGDLSTDNRYYPDPTNLPEK